MTDSDIIAAIIQREGGYVDNPADRGGPTNHGITQATLSAWLGRPATKGEVQDLTADQASKIYMQNFVDTPGFDKIADDNLRAAVVDAGVNHGPGNATRWLQEIAGVAQDGMYGPATQGAVNALPAAHTCAQFVAARGRFYGRLIANDSSQARFAGGWLDRLGTFIEALA